MIKFVNIKKHTYTLTNTTSTKAPSV